MFFGYLVHTFTKQFFMKRIFLPVLLIALLASGNLFAQVSGGVRVGGNLSNLHYTDGGDISESDDSKIGPLFGLYLTAMFSDQFGIQPELVYSAMGSKDGDAKLKLNYIALPVLARYQVAEQFHILLGPQIGFIASAKYVEGDYDEDIKEDVESLDVSGVIGVGADFDRFNVGLRYALGFTSMFDSAEGDIKVKNRALQLVLGYRLFGN
jgi:hypothetical protein|nr:MAG: hypothetical protein DIU61_04130 [Bacteroidota bacterium]